MCRTAGETYPGFRANDPTGPTHTGYRQYSLKAILLWSLLGYFAGLFASLGFGVASRNMALDNVTLGVWERVDPEEGFACKFSEKATLDYDFTLGMPDFAKKYTYGLVCDTVLATEENGYESCRIERAQDYGCPQSATTWYSYFVNASLRGALNEEVDLAAQPVVCCVDRCPEWTEHWYCAPEHYNDGGICDCECGYPDPDCGPDVEPTGWRGCCHEDYVVFGTDHLVGCLNGSSPGAELQAECFENLRCNALYVIPDVRSFPCGFESVRNDRTMPLEVYGLKDAMLWMYFSPLFGLGVYVLCLLSYPLYALCCGLKFKPKRGKVAHEPPPRALNLKAYTGDDEAEVDG
jgi:hypothetical protein